MTKIPYDHRPAWVEADDEKPRLNRRAFLTTSVTPHRIAENFDISPIPEDAMAEISDKLAKTVRYNQVVETGVPGFVPPPA